MQTLDTTTLETERTETNELTATTDNTATTITAIAVGLLISMSPLLISILL